MGCQVKYPLNLNCTAARHAKIGVHAVVNARGGCQWRNDMTHEDTELLRDARAIRDRLAFRIRFYGFNSKFFRRHRARLSHLVSDRND